MDEDTHTIAISDDSEAQFNDLYPPKSFLNKRHAEPIEADNALPKSWRIRDRMKTVSVALVICLNVGVDPPDIFKIQPCSRLECWIDPSSLSPQKAMELIGSNLQKQYERWQPRARYKQSLDPTVEDVKKLCTSLRRNAKEERVLFHYNGHGVPRPTVNGEIWVFNRTYTQYIPLSIYDLQTWMGAPSIYVYDCSNAGIIVNSFNQFAEQHEREMEQLNGTITAAVSTAASSGGNHNSPSSTSSFQGQTYKKCIQLAACSANQILPMNPQLPADLFTSCLTTPIKTALKWFTLQKTSCLVPNVTYDLIERIPGQLNDRRTMLGELNWIFTAITDTIAWNTLPRDLFQKLFRQDLLVASLFRNFLLAERIMRSYDCTPVSQPPLPSGYRHCMWDAWDLAVDLALLQLPDILEHGVPYKNSPFFEDQLTAFHVWLEEGKEERDPPEQLPIVLQVLLSQVHRVRALELLGRFLDLGPWAVNLALSVGIFPYVLKLLQASAKELRPLLVFIWAKILAVDSTCQVDLICDQGHKYFLSVLQDSTISAEYRTLSAFVLASIVHNFQVGQTSALQGSLVSICLVQLCDSNPLLRQWLAICLGHLWQNFDKARWSGVRDMAHEKLYPLLQDNVPEVRAAAVYALGTFISSVTNSKYRTEHANNIDRSIAMTLLTSVGNDMSPLVRMELLAALQWMVILFESQFVTVFLQEPSSASTITTISSTTPAFASSGIGGGTSGILTHSLERNINMKRVSSTNSMLNMSGGGGGRLVSINAYGDGTIGGSNNSINITGNGGGFGSAVSSNISIGTGNTTSNFSTTIGFGSIYMKIWQGLKSFQNDPYCNVSIMAQKLIDFVECQAVELISAKEAAKELFPCNNNNNTSSTSSVSLPPSPNTRVNYISESSPPPQLLQLRQNSPLLPHMSPHMHQKHKHQTQLQQVTPPQLQQGIKHGKVIIPPSSTIVPPLSATAISTTVAAVTTKNITITTNTNVNDTVIDTTISPIEVVETTTNVTKVAPKPQQQQLPFMTQPITAAAPVPTSSTESAINKKMTKIATKIPVEHHLMTSTPTTVAIESTTKPITETTTTTTTAATVVTATTIPPIKPSEITNAPVTIVATRNASGAGLPGFEIQSHYHSSRKSSKVNVPMIQQQQQQSVIAKDVAGEQILSEQHKPIIYTNFIAWSISHFCQPSDIIRKIGIIDRHAPAYLERLRKFNRNQTTKRSCKEQYTRLLVNRIDSLGWFGRTQFTPNIIKLHPYEQQIAVAYRDKVMVNDWMKGNIYSFIPQNVQSQQASSSLTTALSPFTPHFPHIYHQRTQSLPQQHQLSQQQQQQQQQQSQLSQQQQPLLLQHQQQHPQAAALSFVRATSIEFINANDKTLIMVAYEDGSIRVWQQPIDGSATKESKLITAWQAMTNVHGNRMTNIAGLVTSWHQRSQVVVCASDAKFIRYWDAEKELKLCDIVTGSDVSVRVLSSAPSEIVAAGCGDGSVRLFDRRCSPADARFMTYHEHSGAILTTMLRDDCRTIVSGCTQGSVRIFDIRHKASLHNWDVGGDATAMAVHPAAEIMACGTNNLTIYGFDGRQLNTIRNQEGFMGPKFGHASCLYFHPIKLSIAAGFVDNSVSVYVTASDAKK